MSSQTDSTMLDQTPKTNPIIDIYDYLGFIVNSDGSLTRRESPNTTATSDPNHSSPVLTKDIPLNHSKNTWLRIFLPRQASDSSSSATKLPLIVYIHGGGFIIGSAGAPLFHDFCTNMAVEISTVVASVEYRLAPEHRLPAAYDDCVEALQFIRTTNDEWLNNFADLSNCFIMGSSAGGNIAYYASLRAASCVDEDLKPVKIRGLILHQPFFGGTKRTQSELRLANDKMLPLNATDLMWELGLPTGADRDHEYCNPTVESGSHLSDKIKMLGWKVLVSGCAGDPLIDRQIGFAKMLEKKGVKVMGKFGEEGYHGVECFEAFKAKALFVVVKDFMLSSNRA